MYKNKKVIPYLRHVNQQADFEISKKIYKLANMKEPKNMEELDVWRAFMAARDHINPRPEKGDENWVSLYYASNTMLAEKVSLYQVTSWSEKQIIRTNEEGKVYKKDVELLGLIFNAADVAIKNNIFKKSKDVSGKNVLVVKSLQNTKMGKGENTVMAEALGDFLIDPFTKQFAIEYEKIKTGK